MTRTVANGSRSYLSIYLSIYPRSASAGCVTAVCSSCVAWTGTAAGALDATFETHARIEIFSLPTAVPSATASAQPLEPIVSLAVPARVHRLAWTGRSTGTSASAHAAPFTVHLLTCHPGRASRISRWARC